MLKSWNDDKVPVCNHGRPACEDCILDYTVTLIHANCESMLKEIWQAREILMDGQGTIRQLMDRLETLEAATNNIHGMFEKALRRDPTFVNELKKIRENCRCLLPW